AGEASPPPRQHRYRSFENTRSSRLSTSWQAASGRRDWWHNHADQLSMTPSTNGRVRARGSMPWARSLYQRIALGFVAFLAPILVVQTLLFLLVMNQSQRAIPGGSAERFGQSVALDISNQLQRDPHLDVLAYVREEYSSPSDYPFTLILRNETYHIGD